MPTRDNAIDYAKANFNAFQNTLESFIRIPSISTNPANVKDIQSAAEFVKNRLINLGAENVKILETSGHPAVYGALKSKKVMSLPY